MKLLLFGRFLGTQFSCTLGNPSSGSVGFSGRLAILSIQVGSGLFCPERYFCFARYWAIPSLGVLLVVPPASLAGLGVRGCIEIDCFLSYCCLVTFLGTQFCCAPWAIPPVGVLLALLCWPVVNFSRYFIGGFSLVHRWLGSVVGIALFSLFLS